MKPKKSNGKRETTPKKVVSFSIPKKYTGNENFKLKSIQNFLKDQSKGSTKKYQEKLVTYLNVYTNTQKDIKTAIEKTKREVEIKRDNRLSLLKKDKEGKNLWRDNKTGKVIKGKEVQKLMFKSIRVKTIETLSLKEKIEYNQAEKEYKNKLDKKYKEIKQTKKFKKTIAQWKKQGLNKTEIKERAERLAQGRAELMIVRQINQSPK